MTPSSNTIQFIPLVEPHIPLLRGWLKQQHVAEFWTDPEDEAEFRDKYLRKLRQQGILPFIIVLDGKEIGYIQRYEACRVGGGWWTGFAPGIYGIDLLIGDFSQVGHGVGTRVMKQFIGDIFRNASVTEVITDPDPKNARAIRAYEKVGFKNGGPITTPNGSALLMRVSRADFNS